MRQRPAYEFDNRDSEQVYVYLEARIDALKRRIQQLEEEKQALRSTTLTTVDEETRKEFLVIINSFSNGATHGRQHQPQSLNDRSS